MLYLMPLVSVVIVAGGVYIVYLLRRLIQNRADLVAAEKKRIRKETARKLIAIQSRKKNLDRS